MCSPEDIQVLMNTVKFQLESRQQEEGHRAQAIVQNPRSKTSATCARRSVTVQLLVKKSVDSFSFVLQGREKIQQSCDLVPLPSAIESTDFQKRDEDVLVVEEK